MDTSTVRKLRVATKRGLSWERERRTFERISTILTPPPALLQAIPPRTLWGVASGFVRALGKSEIDAARGKNERKRLDQARRAARVELAALLDRLASPTARHATLDVEVLGLCMHLQEVELERGHVGHELDDVASVETDRGERIIVEASSLRLKRSGRKEKTLPRTALGEQQIVVGAPLVLLDEHRAVIAILGDVITVISR
jgi:hypothetical protein